MVTVNGFGTGSILLSRRDGLQPGPRRLPATMRGGNVFMATSFFFRCNFGQPPSLIWGQGHASRLLPRTDRARRLAIVVLLALFLAWLALVIDCNCCQHAD